MPSVTPPFLAFYGDDFTGSTDALESAVNAGARAVLFLKAPSRARLSRFPGIQVVGVAGATRSLGPREMEAELRPALAALKALGARHIHYKVCSTFDSSPEIGSIGRAIDVGASVCQSGLVPLLVGAPQLGRYCVFGNLFARMGIGSAGEIHRLDRHPAMARHPITPAGEADLRLHLARQTSKRCGLFDVLQLELPPRARRAAIQGLVAEAWDVVLFDVLLPGQLPALGELIDGLAPSGRPLFSVGSSSIEAALGAVWAKAGRLNAPAKLKKPAPVDPLFVISGSCSPVTDRQISHALSRGFAELPLEAAEIADAPRAGEVVRRTAAEAVRLLRSGRSVVVHTCRGDADPRLKAGQDSFRGRGGEARTQAARLLGSALGAIARSAVARSGVKRVVVAGGDTSTYAARALGIEALEAVGCVVPGAPLCRAHCPGSSLDGLQLNFKGGQVGADDYFERAGGRLGAGGS
jgi:uncharacterized protein YgbK (DUF1537 family)